MNAEGKAFEWFQRVFCSEMTPQQYYQEFMPRAVDTWVDRESTVTYTPFPDGLPLQPAAAQGRVPRHDPGDHPRRADGRHGQGPGPTTSANTSRKSRWCSPSSLSCTSREAR